MKRSYIFRAWTGPVLELIPLLNVGFDQLYVGIAGF
jgi:hypothetical protein